MRYVQLALLVICLHFGMAFVVASTVYSSSPYYESTMTDINMPDNPLASSDAEQIQTSINIVNTAVNTLSWGWIATYFEPLYSNNQAVATFIDQIILALNGVSTFIIGIGFIEFVRNRLNILGSS